MFPHPGRQMQQFPNRYRQSVKISATAADYTALQLLSFHGKEHQDCE